MKTYKSQVGKLFTERTTLGEFLMKLTKLTPLQLGDVAHKGGVWIQRRGKGKILRIRSLKETLMLEDVVSLNFDHRVLTIPEVDHLESVYEDENYGVWIKPAGVVPQGSPSSDHASLLRYVEKLKNREVYLIHRLDRETLGLMIVGYNSKAAGLLSELFVKNKIKKEYEAVVSGEIEKGHKETITASLDDKEAVTHIEVLENGNGKSLLRVKIETGRLHQIRRHLDHIGHPVMGDPKYGKGNKNRSGLMLVATSLRFQDPWERKEQVFTLDSGLTV